MKWRENTGVAGNLPLLPDKERPPKAQNSLGRMPPNDEYRIGLQQ
jgi:hypothetical protein